MTGTGRSGNPNILADLEGKRTGPKTPGGKARVAMNASKSLSTPGEIDKALAELGITFKKAGEALEIKKLFKSWYLAKTGKELTEIEKLDEVIKILETDATMRVMGKLDKGIPLSDRDIRLIRLLKETLETSHKLKFGDKHLHAHVGYEDIRQMMFDKNVNP